MIMCGDKTVIKGEIEKGTSGKPSLGRHRVVGGEGRIRNKKNIYVTNSNGA